MDWKTGFAAGGVGTRRLNTEADDGEVLFAGDIDADVERGSRIADRGMGIRIKSKIKSKIGLEAAGHGGE